MDTLPNLSDYFVSNRGSDSNDGRSPLTPKLNINSVETIIASTPVSESKPVLNLEEGSIFREEYDPYVQIGSVTNFGLKNTKRLAKITGMDIIRDWQAVPSFNNLYQHLLLNSLDVLSSGYTYIMIAEIDTALEKTKPISAVKYLTLVAGTDQCSRTPGTYYAPDLKTNPVMVYIHPSEGVPGKSKYRYEVTTRNYNINGYYIDNAIYQNLFLQTSAFGYGMLSAGKNTLVKNIIFQGGGIHHTVIKSGHIDSCLFLPGPKGVKDRIAAVFYSAEGTDGRNRVTNTTFLNLSSSLYAHTNGVVNHKSLVLDNVYAFADTTDASSGLGVNDTDSIEVNNCYVEGYPSGWYGIGNSFKIQNSIFRNTSQSAIELLSKSGITGSAKISNVLIKTNGNDNNQNESNGWTAFGVRASYKNTNIEVSNSIIHAYSRWHALYNTVTTFQVVGALKAHHNIYICDVNDENSIHMYKADNSGGRGTSTNVSSDFNAFILLKGSKFHWLVSPNNNNESNISTLSEWQSLTGQDKNSILIDLRDNPLGLRAIFVDPDNGNWTLTESAQAKAIRQISAGMTTPPLYYPLRPGTENNGTPFIKPAGFSSLVGSVMSETESLLQWRTFNEAGFSDFRVEYSWDGTHFVEDGSVKSVNDNKNNTYQFVHTHQETDSIYYRIRYSNTDGASFSSSVVKLKGQFTDQHKIVIYPNPVQQTFTVAHPRRPSGEIRIYDYVGRIIKILDVLPRSSKTFVTVSSIPAGRYFVQWRSGEEKLSSAIIK